MPDVGDGGGELWPSDRLELLVDDREIGEVSLGGDGEDDRKQREGAESEGSRDEPARGPALATGQPPLNGHASGSGQRRVEATHVIGLVGCDYAHDQPKPDQRERNEPVGAHVRTSQEPDEPGDRDGRHHWTHEQELEREPRREWPRAARALADRGQ